jgi:heme oxygenase
MLTEAELSLIRTHFEANPPHDILLAKMEKVLREMYKLSFESRDINNPQVTALIDVAAERMMANIRIAKEVRENA